MNDYKHLRDEPKQPDSDWVYCMITVLMLWAIMHCVAIGWFGG